LGRPAHPRAQHHEALTLARQIGAQHTQARAHDGLAHTYDATGHHDQARRHWQHALTLYTQLGVPDAAHLSAKFRALPG